MKVRGFRVELGEVQAALAAHPAVRLAAVVAPADGYGVRRLIGYVESTALTSGNELREFLRQRLPGFMVPGRIAVLDRLPIGPTGKVDLAALPPVAPMNGDEVAGSADPPEGPVETRLAAIVADVLGLPTVGRHDRFTELGGHSLAAARVVNRVSSEFGVDLPLARFLDDPTVAGLAGALGGGGVALVRYAGRTEYPLTDLQHQFWTLRQVSATPWVTTVGLLFSLSGLPDTEPDPAVVAGTRATVVARALSAVVARHEVLRTRFEARAGGPVAVVGPPRAVAVSSYDGRTSSPRQRRDRAEVFVAQPFDLTSGEPLIRAELCWTGPATAELAVAADHIAFDGISASVLLAELAAELAPATAPAEAVAEPPLQVGDLAIAAERARADRAGAVEAYWRAALAEVVPPYDLPGRPRTAATRHRGARIVRLVDGGLIDRINEVAAGYAVTGYAVWAAALAVLLDGLTGRPDQLIGVTVADRARPGLDRLIGPLLDLLPVRVDCTGDPSFAALAGWSATRPTGRSPTGTWQRRTCCASQASNGRPAPASPRWCCPCSPRTPRSRHRPERSA